MKVEGPYRRCYHAKPVDMNLTATAHFVLYTAEPRGWWDDAAVTLTVTLLGFHSVPETKWNSSSHTLRQFASKLAASTVFHSSVPEMKGNGITASQLHTRVECDVGETYKETVMPKLWAHRYGLLPVWNWFRCSLERAMARVIAWGKRSGQHCNTESSRIQIHLEVGAHHIL
jgi:hypothetical protein